MRMSSPSTIADEIERYLRTGNADMMGNPWPGDIVERGWRQHADIRGALLEELRRLTKGRTHEAVPDDVGVKFTRAKVEPMVRGLFPKAEQGVVLATLERSVVYGAGERRALAAEYGAEPRISEERLRRKPNAVPRFYRCRTAVCAGQVPALEAEQMVRDALDHPPESWSAGVESKARRA